MRLRDYIQQKYFSTPEESVALKARIILDWMSQEYHKEFETWLEQEAAKPLAITNDHTAMIQGAVRVNVFREIRYHLMRLRNRAQAALEAQKE